MVGMFTPWRKGTRSFRSHFSVQHCIPRHDAGCLRFREKPEGSPARQDDCRLSLQSHNLLLRCCLVLVWGRTCTDTLSREFFVRFLQLFFLMFTCSRLPSEEAEVVSCPATSSSISSSPSSSASTPSLSTSICLSASSPVVIKRWDDMPWVLSSP